MSDRSNYPLTGPKNSAERFALIQLDKLVTAAKAMAAALDTAASRTDVAATAVLDVTSDITFTSVAEGSDRNTNTIHVVVNAAAALDADEVHVKIRAASGNDPAALVITVTPNDGTNNDATPVDLTTAELVAAINDGEVAEMNVVIDDPESFRVLQTATGGGAAALAHAGEGDGTTATFSGGITSYTTMLAEVSDIRTTIGASETDFKI